MAQWCYIDYNKITPGRPPVLVLGGLSQIWSLGLADIPVVLAITEPREIALASRYISGYCLLPFSRESGAKSLLVERLLQIGHNLQSICGSKIPLYCGNDDNLSLTYEFHDSLLKHYILIGNGPELGNILLKKDLFHNLALDKGILVPKTYKWDGNDADSVINAENPVIVKPREKEQWYQKGGFVALVRSKAKVYSNGRALLADKDMETIKNRLFIQDYIQGNDNRICSFHGLCDNGGELMEWFLGRKIRTYPKFTGESSFLELIKDEKLFNAGCDVLKKLGLKGVFKLDFKLDSNTGQFYLLEINARFNLWHYLGAANGVNIPQATYDYVTKGIRRKPGGYKTKYKWNDFYLDCLSFQELHSLGELTFGKWFTSLLTPRVYSCFLWKDPAPFIHWSALYISRKIKKWLSMAS